MNCKICAKKIRSHNKTGHCRKHRTSSPVHQAYMANYAVQNSTEIKAYKKQWGKDNAPKINAQMKHRRETIPEVKIASALRSRMNRAIKSNFKSGSVVDLLGCTITEFKQHLEKQFKPGMTWENHTLDGWHIDHIIPLASVDLFDPEQFKKVCHYTNLRPLWWHENLARRLENSQECPTTASVENVR